MRFVPWQSRAETKQNEKRGNPLDNPAVSLSSIDGWGWFLDGGRSTDAGEPITPLLESIITH